MANDVQILLKDLAMHTREMHEVREIPTARGLVAAESGWCLPPALARPRNGLHGRLIDAPRINDKGC